MVRLECCLLLALCLAQVVRTEDRFAEAERLRNIPPELSAAGRSLPIHGGKAQARFLPFSASFSLSAGGNNAQSFSVAGSPDGVGLSQSVSHGSNGIPGSFSASQSSSLAAGLNGLSASDSSSFASNSPFHGPQSQAHGNSFSLGEASASAQSQAGNGIASSGAQSAVGGLQSQASSGSQNLIYLGSSRPGWGYGNQNNDGGYGNPSYASGYNDDYYYYNGRRMPTLTVSVNDRPNNGWYNTPDYSYDSWRQPDYCNYNGGWYRDSRCRNPRVTIGRPGYRPGGGFGPYYEKLRDPRQDASNVHYATASAASSAQSGPGGFAVGQSSSQSDLGQGGPFTSTSNHVESSGDAQAHAQGAGSSVHQGPGGLEASINSATISASSRPGGSSFGSATAGDSGSRVIGSTVNGGSVNGAASSGSVVTFPGPSSHHQIIPREFVRSSKSRTKDNPIDDIVDEITDAVYEVLDE